MSIIKEYPIEHPKNRTIISWGGGDPLLFDDEAKNKVQSLLELHDLSEELEIIKDDDSDLLYMIVDRETEGENVFIELNLDDESSFDVPEDMSSDFIMDLIQYLHRLYEYEEGDYYFLIDASRKNHAIINMEEDEPWEWQDLRELLEM